MTRVTVEQRVESVSPSVYSDVFRPWVALLSCGHKIEVHYSKSLNNLEFARCGECEKIAAKGLGSGNGES